MGNLITLEDCITNMEKGQRVLLNDGKVAGMEYSKEELRKWLSCISLIRKIENSFVDFGNGEFSFCNAFWDRVHIFPDIRKISRILGIPYQIQTGWVTDENGVARDRYSIKLNDIEFFSIQGDETL